MRTLMVNVRGVMEKGGPRFVRRLVIVGVLLLLLSFVSTLAEAASFKLGAKMNLAGGWSGEMELGVTEQLAVHAEAGVLGSSGTLIGLRWYLEGWQVGPFVGASVALAGGGSGLGWRAQAGYAIPVQFGYMVVEAGLASGNGTAAAALSVGLGVKF